MDFAVDFNIPLIEMQREILRESVYVVISGRVFG